MLRIPAIAGALIIALTLTLSAPALAQPDPVAQLLALLRQADGLIAQILAAVQNGDTAAVRSLVQQYVAVMRQLVAQMQLLQENGENGADVTQALETVQQVTLKQQDALAQAKEEAAEEAHDALDMAMLAAMTGHNVATEVLGNINSGTYGKPGSAPGGPPEWAPGLP